MKKIIILISIPFLLALSYYIFIIWAFSSSYWTPLGSPPQPSVKIASYNYNYITVQTSDDKAYRCDIEWQTGCLGWKEVDVVSDVPERTSNYSSYDLLFVLPILGRTVDYDDAGDLPTYMILADGSVWHHYEHDTHIYAGFIDYAYLGAITVFLIGIVISGVIFAISRKRQHEDLELWQ